MVGAWIEIVDSVYLQVCKVLMPSYLNSFRRATLLGISLGENILHKPPN